MEETQALRATCQALKVVIDNVISQSVIQELQELQKLRVLINRAKVAIKNLDEMGDYCCICFLDVCDYQGKSCASCGQRECKSCINSGNIVFMECSGCESVICSGCMPITSQCDKCDKKVCGNCGDDEGNLLCSEHCQS